MPRTILLADDSVTIRKVVELTFNDTDIRVESVGSGREALERLVDLQPDLVIADTVMPAPTGYDICRSVKASERPVPVLLLAGTFEAFDARLAEECGADGHMVKPFESRVLLETVEDLLARPLPAVSAASRAAAVEDLLDEMSARAHPPDASPRLEAAPETGGGTAIDWLLGEQAAPPVPDPPLPEGTGDVAATAPQPEAPAGFPPSLTLSPADLDALARAVVAKLSDQVLREVAWEVVPDLAESIVRERLRQLEQDTGGS